MNCPKCGNTITGGQRFCPNCGTPVPSEGSVQQAPNPQGAVPVQQTPGPQGAVPVQQAPNPQGAVPVQQASNPQGGYAQMNYTQPVSGGYPQQNYAQPAPKKSKTGLIVLIIILAVLLVLGIGIAVLFAIFKNMASQMTSTAPDYDYDIDVDSDIDLDSLNEAIDEMGDLDFSIDGTDTEDAFSPADDTDTTEDTDTDDAFSADEPAGDKTVYSYTDVYRDGNDFIVIPNGGMNSSTKLYGGKDLGGFLDYVDSEVLEEGRTINREFFYDLLATMLVDKDLSSDLDSIEQNIDMALAMANNFHDMDVRVQECYLDANNAAQYRYKVKAYGKDDIWVVNYKERSVFFNDGKTEYHSDMFLNEYLAVWLVAFEEYYGIS